jgi:hypothetical protein
MTKAAPSEVIYEVECTLDPSIAEAFDAWLPGHVREVLACPGFLGAEIHAPAGEVGEAIVRRTQYRLENQAALDRYFEQDAPRLRTDGAARFGDKAAFSRRVLAPREVTARPPETPVSCRNCGAPVPGKFCEDCGQSRDIHVLSMHEVVGDVTHSLLHLDSRVWRTLRTLVLKPGKLTNEFIAGRHQLYLPPFRLYLVISLLFFSLRALLPDASLDVVDGRVIAPIRIGDAPSEPPARAILDEIVADPETPAEVREAISARTGDATGEQSPLDFDLDPRFAWLEEPLERAAEKLRRDQGRRLGQVLLANAPRVMFVFLPLVAAMALLFYWRPRRLYAEHLVFFLHTHALLFLVLTIMALGEYPVIWTASWSLALASAIDRIFGLALFVVLPWYVYRSMRVVYGDGRARTIAKFAVMWVLYAVLLGVVVAGATVYSALSL